MNKVSGCFGLFITAIGIWFKRLKFLTGLPIQTWSASVGSNVDTGWQESREGTKISSFGQTKRTNEDIDIVISGLTEMCVCMEILRRKGKHKASILWQHQSLDRTVRKNVPPLLSLLTLICAFSMPYFSPVVLNSPSLPRLPVSILFAERLFVW